MAAPNIVNVSTIYGKTAAAAVTTTASALVTNASSSGKVIKVNSVYVSNVNGSTAADFTLDIYRGATAYRVANLVSVPAKTVLDVVNKSFYLEEGDVLRVTASANSYLEVACSYEEIS
jgi:hypothetical protein